VWVRQCSGILPNTPVPGERAQRYTRFFHKPDREGLGEHQGKPGATGL
jgi:hypothetical protein